MTEVHYRQQQTYPCCQIMDKRLKRDSFSNLIKNELDKNQTT